MERPVAGAPSGAPEQLTSEFTVIFDEPGPLGIVWCQAGLVT
jgi:hypothetical protein